MPPIEREISLATRAFPGGPGGKAARDELTDDGIRSTSVIHGMRWWFRALAGGWLGSSDHALEGIRAKENDLFGSTSAASRVWISIRRIDGEVGVGGVGHAGGPISYLAFPRTRDSAYLPQGWTSLVRLSRFPESARLLLESLLDLWIHLGGAGGRWRHGLGAMWIPEHPVAVNDVVSMLSSGRELMREHLGCGSSTGITQPAFPVAHPEHLSVRGMAFSGPSEEQILETCKSVWFKFRSPGVTRIKTSPKGGSYPVTPTFNCDAFHQYAADVSGGPLRFTMLGLPLPFRANNIPGVANWASGQRCSRLESPVWIRPLLLSAEKGEWELAVLGWRFALPDGRNLAVTVGRSVIYQWSAPPLSVEVDAFLASLPADWPAYPWG